MPRSCAFPPGYCKREANRSTAQLSDGGLFLPRGVAALADQVICENRRSAPGRVVPKATVAQGLASDTPQPVDQCPNSIHFAFIASISVFWANAGTVSLATKAITRAILRITHAPDLR